jgi:WD40 repeat protein
MRFAVINIRQSIPIVILAAHLLGVVSQAGIAQIAENAEPILSLAYPRHTATVRAVEYTPDGKYLVTAGLDKRVLAWDTDNSDHPWRLARQIRWDIEFGPHGRIFALGAAPDDTGGTRLAFAGTGYRGTLGEIAWGNPESTELDSVDFAHTAAVTDLKATTDGRLWFSIDLSGRILMRAYGDEVPLEIRGKDTDAIPEHIGPPSLRPLAILGNSAVAIPYYIGLDDAGHPVWRVSLAKIPVAGRTKGIAPPPEGAPIIGGAQEVPILGPPPKDPMKTKVEKLTPLPSALDRLDLKGFAVAMAADPKGNYLGVSDLSQISVDGRLQSVFYVYDRAADKVLGPIPVPAPAMSIAISGDGNYVVTGLENDGDSTTKERSSVLVWKMADLKAGAYSARTHFMPARVSSVAISPDSSQFAIGTATHVVVKSLATGKQAAALIGGSQITQAAFIYQPAAGSHRIYFKTTGLAGDKEQEFEVEELLLQTRIRGDAALVPRTMFHGRDSVTLDPARHIAKLSSAAEPIDFDKKLQGRPEAYCWLGQVDKDRRLIHQAVAIGCEFGGIFIYTPGGKLIRVLEGHSDRVVDVNVSQDGRYLVSASLDGTVKVWPLEALFKPFPLANWGMDLKEIDGKLVVAAMADNAPTTRKRLRVGDVIAKIEIWNDGKKVTELARPADMLKHLDATVWHSQVVFDTTRDGKAQPRFQMRHSWPELLTLYSAGTEWIAWHPDGYYASSAGGDTLIGWQINGEQIKGQDTPQFHAAEKFFNGFYRPQAIKSLLTAGSIGDALAARPPENLRIEPPKPEVKPPVEAAPDPPKVVILQPADDHFVSTLEVLEIVARIDERLPKDKLRLLVDDNVAVVNVDGRAIPVAPVVSADDPLVWTWKLPLATGLQRVRVEAVSTADSIGIAEVLVEKKATVTETLPPTVTMEQPELIRDEEGAEVWKIVAHAKSNSPHPIKSLSLLINGRVPDKYTKAIVRREREKTEEWQIKLPPGRHVLAARAVTAVSSNVSLDIPVEFQPESFKLPSLRVVAVGVSDYQDRALRLDFADDDARKIDSVFNINELNLADKLYKDVQVHMLTDANATKKNIEAEMEWLAENVAEGDVGIFFFSGHGKRHEGNFYLVPQDANVDKIAETCVAQGKVEALVRDVTNRGDIVLMIDACHSGALNIDTLGKVIFERNRAVVFTSSRANERSYEGYGIESGFFTYAIHSGLKGDARVGNNEFVEHGGLASHVNYQVTQLVDQRVNPRGDQDGFLPQTPACFAMRPTPLKLTRPERQPEN